MTNPTSEKAIEKLIANFCKDHGMVTLKLEGSHAAGKPDRAIWYWGAIVIEVKSKGKKPTALQRSYLAKFRQAGILSYCVDNWPDAHKILVAFYEQGEQIRLQSTPLPEFDY